jgi:hypothetical protein
VVAALLFPSSGDQEINQRRVVTQQQRLGLRNHQPVKKYNCARNVLPTEYIILLEMKQG